MLLHMLIYIHASHLAWDPCRTTILLNEKRIRLAFRTAKAVVHMGHGAWVAEPAERVQEYHAVHPTAHGDMNGLVRSEHALAPDVAADLIQHGQGH